MKTRPHGAYEVSHVSQADSNDEARVLETEEHEWNGSSKGMLDCIILHFKRARSAWLLRGKELAVG